LLFVNDPDGDDEEPWVRLREVQRASDHAERELKAWSERKASSVERAATTKAGEESPC
jgi:hypothetical protein